MPVDVAVRVHVKTGSCVEDGEESVILSQEKVESLAFRLRNIGPPVEAVFDEFHLVVCHLVADLRSNFPVLLFVVHWDSVLF